MDSEVTKERHLDDCVTSPRADVPGEFLEPPTTLWTQPECPGEDWLDPTTPRTSREPRGSSAPPMTRERLRALAQTAPAPALGSGRVGRVDGLARTDMARTELARTDMARTELARTDMARTELARTTPKDLRSARVPLALARTTPVAAEQTPPPQRQPRQSRPPLGVGSNRPGSDQIGSNPPMARRIEPTELADPPRGLTPSPSRGRMPSPSYGRTPSPSPEYGQNVVEAPVPQGQYDVGDSTSVLSAGFELGNYLIRRQIAKGGMGVVYEAEHRYLRRRVAIKVLRESRLRKPEVVRRFFREAVAATQIGHSGVVEVIDYGHAPAGGAYLVMELLQGESLADRLNDRHQMSVHEAIDIGRAIADITAAAHAAGIVHRDLKPDNIFLARGEEEYDHERVKVLDFGVAKFLQASDGDRTKLGKLLGTPYYMSPEQCEGRREVDHRSDIYALGCLLFEMLTGRCPFSGHTVDVLIAHRRHAPPSVREFNPDVPPEIDALVQQMLAKRPEQRPQSMAQVVAELTLVERSHSGSMDGPVAFGSSDMPDPAALVRVPGYKRTMARQRGRSLFAKFCIVMAGLVLTAAAAATTYLTVWNGKLPFDLF